MAAPRRSAGLSHSAEFRLPKPAPAAEGEAASASRPSATRGGFSQLRKLQRQQTEQPTIRSAKNHSINNPRIKKHDDPKIGASSDCASKDWASKNRASPRVLAANPHPGPAGRPLGNASLVAKRFQAPSGSCRDFKNRGKALSFSAVILIHI